MDMDLEGQNESSVQTITQYITGSLTKSKVQPIDMALSSSSDSHHEERKSVTSTTKKSYKNSKIVPFSTQEDVSSVSKEDGDVENQLSVNLSDSLQRVEIESSSLESVENDNKMPDNQSECSDDEDSPELITKKAIEREKILTDLDGYVSHVARDKMTMRDWTILTFALAASLILAVGCKIDGWGEVLAESRLWYDYSIGTIGLTTEGYDAIYLNQKGYNTAQWWLGFVTNLNYITIPPYLLARTHKFIEYFVGKQMPQSLQAKLIASKRVCPT
jgi:hypothetical protein